VLDLCLLIWQLSKQFDFSILKQINTIHPDSFMEIISLSMLERRSVGKQKEKGFLAL